MLECRQRGGASILSRALARLLAGNKNGWATRVSGSRGGAGRVHPHPVRAGRVHVAALACGAFYEEPELLLRAVLRELDEFSVAVAGIGAFDLPHDRQQPDEVAVWADSAGGNGCRGRTRSRAVV